MIQSSQMGHRSAVWCIHVVNDAPALGASEGASGMRHGDKGRVNKISMRVLIPNSVGASSFVQHQWAPPMHIGSQCVRKSVRYQVKLFSSSDSRTRRYSVNSFQSR